MPIPVGLNIWSRLVAQTYPYVDQVIAPFDSLWLPDHVMYNGHDVAEGWTLLSYALGRYDNILCGHQVMCNSFRNPAHLAKMAATAQHLSGGRFVLGIGAGWNEEEYLAYGWPFPSARVRIEQLAESIEICRLMWAEGPVNYEGAHYQVKDAYCQPLPDPVPPVMVGGAGERYLLRVVAQHADWWNYIYRDRETYAHKQEALKNHCRDIGRDYDEIQQVIAAGILIADSEKDLKRLQAEPHARPANGGLMGTPEQVTERLLEGIKQGAHRLVVSFNDSPSPEGSWLFAAAVLPHLQNH